MPTFAISRRQSVLGAASLAAAGLAGVSFANVPDVAAAKAPMLKSQAPYFYRSHFGKMQITMVSDGPLPLGDPSTNFLGASKDEISKLLTDNFLSPTSVVLEQNSPVVNTGTNLVLFDTGMGTLKAFGPTTGRLIQSMREAGIQPGKIDTIIISHAHIDHIGGLVDARGRRIFPNATVYLNEADFKFWTDEAKLKDEKIKAFIEHARKNLLPYRDRLKFVKDGDAVVPGITAIAAPGHTVGHMVYMIESDGKQACFIGDLTHHQILLVEKPRLEFAYDTDPKQSASTRVRILDMLASKKIPIMAYHFPWPGMGHVSKHGDGFKYHASAMELVAIPPKKA